MENQLFLKVSFYQIAVCLILSVGTLCFNSGRLKISLNVPYPCKLSYAACTRYNLVFSWWLSVIIIYLFWLLWLVKVKEALRWMVGWNMFLPICPSLSLPARWDHGLQGLLLRCSVCLVRYQSSLGDSCSVMIIRDSIAQRVISSNFFFFLLREQF